MDLEAVEPHAIYRAVEDVDPEGTFFSKIVDEKVLEAIDALPPEFREVLVLSDMEDMRYGEIAETLERAGRHREVPAVPGPAAAPGRRSTQYAVETGIIKPRETPMGESLDCREAADRLHDFLKQELTPERGGGDAGPSRAAAARASRTRGSSRASSRCCSSRRGRCGCPDDAPRAGSWACSAPRWRRD